MISISVKIEDGEVRSMLRGIAERTGNLTPAMKIIGAIIKDSVLKNFMVGGRPKWRPSKRAMKEGGRTLVDKAILQNSINPKAFSDRAEVGTNVIYSAIHQFGGKAGKGHKVNIPARPFLMVQDEDWTEIKAALTAHILKGAK